MVLSCLQDKIIHARIPHRLGSRTRRFSKFGRSPDRPPWTWRPNWVNGIVYGQTVICQVVPQNASGAKELNMTERTSMHITRRKLLLLGGVAIVSFVLGGTLFARRGTLEAFLDTPIPRDEFGPSATDVGLTKEVLTAADRNILRKAELEIALAWMNLRARGNFASRNETERNAIVSRMAELKPNSVLGGAYYRTRSTCMLHYYGNADRAVQLGFVGAPQPEGHLDPAQPWAGITGG